MQLLKKESATVTEFDWGSLTWFANSALGQPEYTLGICRILQSKSNPQHFHPNCNETLYVMKGSILHYVEDKCFEMSEGDTITIPAGIKHYAVNTGTQTTELYIAFSCGNRETIND